MTHSSSPKIPKAKKCKTVGKQLRNSRKQFPLVSFQHKSHNYKAQIAVIYLGNCCRNCLRCAGCVSYRRVSSYVSTEIKTTAAHTFLQIPCYPYYFSSAVAVGNSSNVLVWKYKISNSCSTNPEDIKEETPLYKFQRARLMWFSIFALKKQTKEFGYSSIKSSAVFLGLVFSRWFLLGWFECDFFTRKNIQLKMRIFVLYTRRTTHS